MATETATTRAAGMRDLLPRVLDLLPGKQADIARALDRRPSDGTVRRALEKLATDGLAQRVDGIWRRCQDEPALPESAFPDDFDQQSRALFERTKQQLVEQGTWKDGDEVTLESYVRSKQLAREARAKVREHGAYTRTNAGRVFRHPAIDDARGHESDALKLADALLIPPKARGQRASEGGGGVDPLDDF